MSGRQNYYLDMTQKAIRRAKGLLTMTHPRYGQQLWGLGKYVGRKKSDPKNCVVCEKQLTKNEEVWRPITNAGNRMDRICFGCLPEKESFV